MAVQLTNAANSDPNQPMHTVQIIPYASVITLDCSIADTFDITMTGDARLDLINGSNSQKILVRLKQDGIGGRVITMGSMISMSVDIPVVTLSISPNKLDLLGLVYNSPTSQFQVAAYTRGFN
jgi:hypothetical protein